MDDYYRDDYDCHGAWQYLRRKVRRQKSRSGQAVWKDPACSHLDCMYSRCREIYYSCHFGSIDLYGKFQFLNLGRLSGMYGHICIPAVFAGDGNAVSGEIYGGQPCRQRKNRRHAKCFQHHRKYFGNIPANFCNDPGCGDFRYFFGICRDTAVFVRPLLCKIQNRRQADCCGDTAVFGLLCGRPF